MDVKNVVCSHNPKTVYNFLSKNKMLDEVIQLTLFLGKEVKWGQRLFHIRNNMYGIPKCRCGTNLKYQDNKHRYNHTCGDKKCVDTIKNERYKKSCLEKYGVDNHSKTKKFREQLSMNNPMKNDVVKEKYKEIFHKNHGVDNPAKLKESHDKRKKSCLEKYGSESYSNTEDFKNKYRETSIKKYGTTTPSHNKEIKEKISIGVKSNINIESRQKSAETLRKKGIEKMKSIQGYELIDYGESVVMKHLKCNRKFEVKKRFLINRKSDGYELCTECYPIKSHTSQAENELLEFVKLNYGGDVVCNTNKIISPYHLDIYLPEKNIAFEYNGLYWHSNVYKDINYHKDKTKLCSGKNIHLVHIFEDDWLYRKDIVKSVINNMLGKNKKIYARECHILEVDTKQARGFLTDNHIQGFAPSTIYYGLYYNKELVQMMTFNKKGACFELNRLSSKKGITVVGGSNKLFKNFIKNNKFSCIISYCDKSMFTGNVYRNMGMIYDGSTQPIKSYFFKDKIERIHRRSGRRMGGNPYFIYNSGLDRYIYTPDVDKENLLEILPQIIEKRDCYVASEAIYYLYGAKKNYIPHRLIHEGIPHWYLSYGKDVIDITKNQFQSEINYSTGVPQKFRSISKRCKEIIDKVVKYQGLDVNK